MCRNTVTRGYLRQAQTTNVQCITAPTAVWGWFPEFQWRHPFLANIHNLYTVRSSITALEKQWFSNVNHHWLGISNCYVWLSHVIPIFYIVIHELSFLRSNPMPLKNTPSTALVEASNLAALNGSSVVVLGSKVCWNMDEIGFIPWYPMENGDLRILRGIWVGIYGDILWCN